MKILPVAFRNLEPLKWYSECHQNYEIKSLWNRNSYFKIVYKNRHEPYVGLKFSHIEVISPILKRDIVNFGRKNGIN